MATQEPAFTSDRLEYYKYTQTDLEGYTSWYTNEAAMKYVTLKPLTVVEAHLKFAQKLEANKKYCSRMGGFSVRLKDTGTFIGLAHLTYMDVEICSERAEVGYGMLPEFWGKGYATEILRALVNVAKEIKIAVSLRELITEVHPQNAASIKILTNQGFTWYASTVEEDEPIEHYKYAL